jgi:putative aldouronate transport system substrate-binding protein
MKEVRVNRLIKVLALLGAFLAAAVVAVAEGTPEGTAAAGATAFRYVMPGTPAADNDMVIAAVNEKLKAQLKLELQTTYIPWDAWENKINLMLASGEEFDLFHVMQDWIPYATYFSKGGLADITDAIARYGANLKKAIPAEIWGGASVKGKTYVIPTFWVELASEGDFAIRGDLLAANGLAVPTTPEELLAAAEKVAANWKGKDRPYLPMTPSSNNADPIGMHSSVLHRAYASFPFTVKEKLFYVSQTGEVKSWVETPEFKQDAAWFRVAYQKKLINPDVLTIKQEQFSAQIDSGNWLASFGTIGGLAVIQKNWPDLKDADILSVKFNPGKPNVRPWGIKNCNAVSSTSRHPEAGVKFLNWLYGDQASYDLFIYGIEGKHYTRVGDRKRNTVLDAAGQPLYTQADWMMGNLNFIRVDALTPTATFKDLYVIDTKAINSPAADFFFDASNVRAELANVMSQFAASMLPVYIGVLDWEANYAQALDKMKKAGLDKVVAEYRAQLAAFRSAR